MPLKRSIKKDLDLASQARSLFADLEDDVLTDYDAMIKSAARYRRLCGSCRSFDELVTDGYVALYEALRRFRRRKKHETNATFSTYAYNCLEGQMKDTLGFADSFESLSHEKEGKDGQMQSLESVLPSKAPSPDCGVLLNEVWGAVSLLSARQRLVLVLRYKMGISLEEVGDYLHVSRQRAKQLEAAALKHVKKHFKLIAERKRGRKRMGTTVKIKRTTPFTKVTPEVRFGIEDLRCPICKRVGHSGLTKQLSQAARDKGIIHCATHGPVEGDILLHTERLAA